MTNFTWSELAFGSKKPLSSLKAIFIAAPREISVKRFTQFVKEYLPIAPIVVGIAAEDYIDGFEFQPQFKTLQQKTIQSVIDKVNASATVHKIHSLTYQQRDLPFILEKVTFLKTVFVNGSWHHSFHTLPQYYTLMNNRIPYTLVSPFSDEAEALQYEADITKQIPEATVKKIMNETELMLAADEVAKQSFDNGFQTGAVLAKKTKNGYQLIETGFNKVVPYQTFALLEGASRERHFSPVNDLNHYDTIHAEMMLLTKMLSAQKSVKGLSLFVNLMPCPNCARNLAETDIAEVVYRTDHSEGYAVQLFEKNHKKVRRLV